MIDARSQAEELVRQGMACVRRGEFSSAAEHFQRAADTAPDFAVAHSNLGSALAALGRHSEAVASFRQALQIDRRYAQAQFNLGASLQVLGVEHEALESFIRTLEIDPQHAEAHYYLGLDHKAQGRPNEAAASFLRATDYGLQEAEVYVSLGLVLGQLRLDDAAIQAFERALELDPGHAGARAHLLFRLARNCDWKKLELHREWIPRLGVIGSGIPPFLMLALEDDPDHHRTRSEKFADWAYSNVPRLAAGTRPPARPERLRIGYFSSDFYDHATMFLAARLFEMHDRSRFSIHAYSYSPVASGQMHARVTDAFDTFQDVRTLSDWNIAELAREDGIDIAVDLKGYTENQRLGILAHRPAPIQVSYLGYPGTLGTTFVDYLIVDKTVVPDDLRAAYSEKLIYLPDSYQANDNNRALTAQVPTRQAAGLPESGFVFCSFNNPYKITRAEFEIWMDLLNNVEGAVLWLLAATPRVAANLRAVAAELGVNPDRLVFAPRVDAASHLARNQLADLFLDTFNCNAHTTASDALWSGLPVLTKIGRGFAARVAASLLRAVGLSELVTETNDEYAQMALSLAKEPAKLDALRARLSSGRASLPLFDSGMTTRHIETGFDLAYQAYIEGREPADIIIPPARS